MHALKRTGQALALFTVAGLLALLVWRVTHQSHPPTVGKPAPQFALDRVDGAGRFVVVWQGITDLASGNTEVFAQRYAADGTPLGGEFRVNTYTTGRQRIPRVAADLLGDFVVV